MTLARLKILPENAGIVAEAFKCGQEIDCKQTGLCVATRRGLGRGHQLEHARLLLIKQPGVRESRLQSMSKPTRRTWLILAILESWSLRSRSSADWNQLEVDCLTISCPNCNNIDLKSRARSIHYILTRRVKVDFVLPMLVGSCLLSYL